MKTLIFAASLLASLTLISMGASSLTFNASAKPATLVLNGVNRFSSLSTAGFHLRYFDGKDVIDKFLNSATTSGKNVTVSESGGLPSFTFRIETYPKHVAIHLVDVQGIGEDERNWGIRLILKGNATLGAFALDDIASAGNGFPPRYSSTQNIDWKYPRHVESDGRRGAIVLYDGTLTGTTLDATLAEIWASENMPRPAGQATWTEADVLAWVAQYRTKFTALSEIQMEAGNLTELYALTNDYVLPNGIKRVYLHTNTWRGEYWPNLNSRVHVNTDVFPAGKPDLLAYANYLHSHGVMLRLHNVSCGIGRNEAAYVGGTVDRRLAGWGSGTLESAVNTTEKRLLFRPSPETVIPLTGQGLSHTGKWLNYQYVRINEEIVQVGSFSRTEDAVWVLENCTRGYQGTDAAAHAAGSDAAGLYCSYGKNYIPKYDLDQPNSLMDELALEYGSFVNDLQLDHLHFDGPEIHEIDPWVIRELLSKVYSYVRYPVTSSRVGRSISANFEQAFSGINDNLTLGYFPLEVGIRLEYLTKPVLATSWLDTHFHVQEGILLDGRRLTLTVPQSGLGISQNVLATHGLTDKVLGLFDDWQLLVPVLAQADVDFIDSQMTKTPGSNHYQGEDVLVLEKDGSGDYIFTPNHVMGRTSGTDTPWKIEQEWGAVARRQLITTGATLSLNNPKAAQELRFIIRISDASKSLVNPTISINSGAGSLAITGTVAPGEYVEFESGSSVKVYNKNWKLLRTLPATKTSFNVAAGTNTVSVTVPSGAALPALDVQFIVKGTPYVLATNSNL